MKPQKIKLRILKEYRAFLLPVLILGMVVLSALLILKPKIGEIMSMREDLSTERENLAKVTQKLAALEGLNENELSQRVEETFKFLPADKDLPGALVAIRSLSQETGLELVNIKVSPGTISTESAGFKTETKGGAPFLGFQISVKGGLGVTKEFLGRLGKTAPLMKVKNLKVNADEGGERADVLLDIFYLPLPEAMGSVESPLPTITSQEEKAYRSLKEIEVFQPAMGFIPVASGKENPFSL